jgi:hypothetical protein
MNRLSSALVSTVAQAHLETAKFTRSGQMPRQSTGTATWIQRMSLTTKPGRLPLVAYARRPDRVTSGGHTYSM